MPVKKIKFRKVADEIYQLDCTVFKSVLIVFSKRKVANFVKRTSTVAS